jgi:hypothetical protein
VQIGTTKGTGGDVLILEEAAYCDEGFFYETVAPILSIGSASLVAISTLTSEINFYTRLIQMVDPGTERPLFAIRCIELCCERCKADGKQAECVHMLHLVPMWQSEERHRKLKIMMQDRPDLIQSELAGLAFDSLQQVFRKSDIAIAMALEPLPMPDNPFVFLVIDPAAGGPQSDYAVVSIVRERGSVTVSAPPRCDPLRSGHGPHVLAPGRERDDVGPLVAHEVRHRVSAEIHEEVRALSLLHRRLAVDDHPLHLGVDVEQQEEERQRLYVREPGCLDALADVAHGGVLGRHVVLLADARQALQAVVLDVHVVHGHQDSRDQMRHALELRGGRLAPRCIRLRRRC